MKKYIRKIYLLIIAICFFSSCAIKRNELRKNDELITEIINVPKSITRTIIHDRQGNLWFATWEGIIKFDGEKFTNLTREVSLNGFFSILEDKKGNFWLGSLGSGAYFFDGTTFQNYTTKDGLANDRIKYIYEDKSGKIWFATDGGVSCFDGNSFQNFSAENGLPNNDINTILEDRNGRFWIGTRSNAYYYNGEAFEIITNNEGKSFENVRHIIEDSKGNIWLGGNNGLWLYNNSQFRNITEKFVGYIYEDIKGNIWTSSESKNIKGWAITRYDRETLNDEKIISTEVIAEEGMYFGITEDLEGNIWFGTLNGVLRYNGETFENFKAQNNN